MSTPTVFSPTVGYAGRVKVANLNGTTALDFSAGFPDTTVVATTAANASISRWEITKRVQSGKVVTFESATDSNTGVAWEQTVVGGIGSWQVTIEGYVDTDSSASATPETADNTDAFWWVGRYVKMDLLYNKTSVYGMAACYGKITSFRGGSQATGDANKFTIEVEGHGALPRASMTPI